MRLLWWIYNNDGAIASDTTDTARNIRAESDSAL